MAAGERRSGLGSSADDGDGPSLADYLEFGAQQDAHAAGLMVAVAQRMKEQQFMDADRTGTLRRWSMSTQRSAAVQGGCWGRSRTMWSGACRRRASWQRRTSGRSSTCRGEQRASALAPCSVTLSRPVTVASEWQHVSC